MSRGWGRRQKDLFFYIRDDAAGPMTFEEIAKALYQIPDGRVLRQPIERSLRRALRRLVDDTLVLALGPGGRSNPHRYLVAPQIYLRLTPPQMDRFASGMKFLEENPHFLQWGCARRRRHHQRTGLANCREPAGLGY